MRFLSLLLTTLLAAPAAARVCPAGLEERAVGEGVVCEDRARAVLCVSRPLRLRPARAARLELLGFAAGLAAGLPAQGLTPTRFSVSDDGEGLRIDFEGQSGAFTVRGRARAALRDGELVATTLACGFIPAAQRRAAEEVAGLLEQLDRRP